MKAYIFKSKRARRMLLAYSIPQNFVKQLQGKTFPITSDEGYKGTATVCINFLEGYLYIPLEACNIIDFPPIMEDGE